MKKNYIDPTAGFFYIIGCSLVHFSLIIGGMFVLYPDMEKAKKQDAAFNLKIATSGNFLEEMMLNDSVC